MAHQLVIRPEAEADIAETYRWYEDQKVELGKDFLLALDTTFQLIRQTPKLFPKLYKNIRRVLIRRFPYGIFYLEEKDRVVVLAVLHARRDPERWP
ncbi:MAG: type II toxin-antitoxin system RelE/ParE family toxin [Candidatus Marinimicrobia bacterium]|nr:type II toxin-antitoxin system RelE/ParE family toxin [Candidatus Neomarinimicrobiota bacterium]